MNEIEQLSQTLEEGEAVFYRCADKTFAGPQFGRPYGDHGSVIVVNHAPSDSSLLDDCRWPIVVRLSPRVCNREYITDRLPDILDDIPGTEGASTPVTVDLDEGPTPDHIRSFEELPFEDRERCDFPGDPTSDTKRVTTITVRVLPGYSREFVKHRLRDLSDAIGCEELVVPSWAPPCDDVLDQQSPDIMKLWHDREYDEDPNMLSKVATAGCWRQWTVRPEERANLVYMAAMAHHAAGAGLAALTNFLKLIDPQLEYFESASHLKEHARKAYSLASGTYAEDEV